LIVVPLRVIVTGNVVVVAIPDGACTEASMGVEERFVLALTRVEKLSPGEMLTMLGDAESER
jgi:hypothetical protein